MFKRRNSLLAQGSYVSFAQTHRWMINWHLSLFSYLQRTSLTHLSTKPMSEVFCTRLPLEGAIPARDAHFPGPCDDALSAATLRRPRPLSALRPNVRHVDGKSLWWRSNGLCGQHTWKRSAYFISTRHDLWNHSTSSTAKLYFPFPSSFNTRTLSPRVSSLGSYTSEVILK